eukprot:Gb_32178 [translate_table: standard]
MVPKGLILGFVLCFLSCEGQVEAQPVVVAPSPTQESCNGVYLSYQATAPTKTFPYVSKPSEQAYIFKSTATVLNTGNEDVMGWKLFIGFQHREVLVSASGVVIEDGSIFPANVTNGTVLAGFPQTDLKTAIETAGDMTRIQVQIEMTGTEFGVGPRDFPMPTNISLVNDGFKCGKAVSSTKSLMEVCCKKDPNFVPLTDKESQFLPREEGDLTISYDVTQAYESNYLAQVTISNDNPIGRLDNWNLTWQWQRGEFIYGMKGAETLEQSLSDCLNGAAGNYYQELDFSNVMNCQMVPTIIDLTPEKANDSKVGKIPFCCRNGTLLPSIMDSSKSKAAFQLQVFKIPPDVNRTKLYPPLGWKINGVLNPDYQCGQPRRVDPTMFPDPSGSQRTTSAIASWQIVCNITQPANTKPRCCVSYSAFYNESVIPCRTCACGCPSSIKPTCSRTANAMFLRPEALLIPFNNRTSQALAWAGIKHFPVPSPLPCGDYCGVSINWHINSDYSHGWSARITLFNWDDYTFADWFTAIEMSKAFPGYEDVYSFNGTKVPGLNNTIFMQGKPGLNYLNAEKDGNDPTRDPRVPGKQQSVLSFSKKPTPGINILAGDGFPKKVIFNGEECALPHIIPSGAGHVVIRIIPTLLVALVILTLL